MKTIKKRSRIMEAIRKEVAKERRALDEARTPSVSNNCHSYCSETNCSNYCSEHQDND